MIALQLKNTKNFMNALLVSEQFDSFLVEEVTITTFNTFSIDGHTVKEFYSSDEDIEELQEFSSWKDIRPVCFQLIKGKRTPVSFKVVLHANPSLTEKITSDPDCDVAGNLVRSLVLNIKYDNGHVTCVTATSFKTFLMDKSLDNVWDKYIRALFSELGIDFD